MDSVFLRVDPKLLVHDFCLNVFRFNRSGACVVKIVNGKVLSGKLVNIVKHACLRADFFVGYFSFLVYSDLVDGGSLFVAFFHGNADKRSSRRMACKLKRVTPGFVLRLFDGYNFIVSAYRLASYFRGDAFSIAKRDNFFFGRNCL